MSPIRTAPLCAFALFAWASTGAFAQVGFSGISGSAPAFAPPPASAPQPQTPPTAQPRAAAAPPVALAPPTSGPRDPHAFIPQVAPGKVALAVSARYAADGAYIPRAMIWRVFA